MLDSMQVALKITRGNVKETQHIQRTLQFVVLSPAGHRTHMNKYSGNILKPGEHVPSQGNVHKIQQG
jgi:hypothetical protein